MVYFVNDNAITKEFFTRSPDIVAKDLLGKILVRKIGKKKLKAEAVLIRAVLPLNFNLKCKGPGLLCKALGIDERFNKQNIIDNKEIWIEYNIKKFEITESFRIGVGKDLERKLRYYIKLR